MADDRKPRVFNLSDDPAHVALFGRPPDLPEETKQKMQRALQGFDYAGLEMRILDSVSREARETLPEALLRQPSVPDSWPDDARLRCCSFHAFAHGLGDLDLRAAGDPWVLMSRRATRDLAAVTGRRWAKSILFSQIYGRGGR